MSVFLTILSIIAGCIGLVLLLALFTKKNYSVEREIVIHRNVPDVFEYIKLLKNQDNFSKWASMDPNMKKDFKGIDGTPGATSLWESAQRNVGTGEQEIKKIIDGKRVDYELRFIKPFKGLAQAYLTTESGSNASTQVKWGFASSMPYPMNFLLLFMNMEKMIGKDFEIGLQNLKNILEK